MLSPRFPRFPRFPDLRTLQANIIEDGYLGGTLPEGWSLTAGRHVAISIAERLNYVKSNYIKPKP